MSRPVFSAASEARPPERSIGIWPTDRKKVATSFPFSPGRGEVLRLGREDDLPGDGDREEDRVAERQVVGDQQRRTLGRDVLQSGHLGAEEQLDQRCDQEPSEEQVQHPPSTSVTRPSHPSHHPATLTNPSSAVPRPAPVPAGGGRRQLRRPTVPVRTLRSSFPHRQCHRQESGCCSPCCHLDADWTQPRCDHGLAHRSSRDPGRDLAACEDTDRRGVERASARPRGGIPQSRDRGERRRRSPAQSRIHRLAEVDASVRRTSRRRGVRRRRTAPARSRDQLAGDEQDRLARLVRRARQRTGPACARSTTRSSWSDCRWAAAWYCGWPSSTARIFPVWS